MDLGETSEKGSSQIFCVTWIKQNVAKLIPDDVKLSGEEIQDIIG